VNNYPENVVLHWHSVGSAISMGALIALLVYVRKLMARVSKMMTKIEVR
jgi:hypothetical protein